jgi:hypothetical protein
METYKEKLDKRVCVLYQPLLLGEIKPVTRQELINRDWVIEQPLIRKRGNWARKDVPLNKEQIENLASYLIVTKVKDSKTQEYRVMYEKDVLAVLRKKHKRYRFDPKATILILT